MILLLLCVHFVSQPSQACCPIPEQPTYNETDITATSKGCDTFTALNIPKSSSGTIQSHYPFNKVSKYLAGSSCTWKLQSQDDGTQIRLEFSHFSLTKSDGCADDFLSIRDGNNDLAKSLGKYCGETQPPNLISSGRDLFIQFKSNPKKSIMATGFQIRYMSDEVCGKPAISPVTVPYILGGVSARPHSFPWQVQIQLGHGAHMCGSTLISTDYVLTAGHCLDHRDVLAFKLRMGAHGRKTNEGVFIPLEKTTVILHGEYHVILGRPDYDFALIKLHEPVQLTSKISPACLPTTEAVIGRKCVVSGWGLVNRSEILMPDELQQVELPVVNWDVCKKELGGFFTKRMMCAGGEPSNIYSACRGDSGGGLMCKVNDRFEVTGMTSWGLRCTIAWMRKPGVYADVYKILGWISMVRSKTWKKGTVWSVDSKGVVREKA